MNDFGFIYLNNYYSSDVRRMLSAEFVIAVFQDITHSPIVSNVPAMKTAPLMRSAIRILPNVFVRSMSGLR